MFIVYDFMNMNSMNLNKITMKYRLHDKTVILSTNICEEIGFEGSKLCIELPI